MLLTAVRIGAASALLLTGCTATSSTPDPRLVNSEQFEGSTASGSRPLRDIDVYVRSAMRQWGVPGISIAVVKDDSVVLARGYGLRQLGGDESVTEHTLFAIGSCTKAFTATVLAMLVGEGRLEWDTPVIQYMPTFRVADAHITQNATPRDLLTNRSGAPGLDAGEIGILFGAATSREDMLQRIAELPGWGFRSRFDYSNAMYVAAGQLIPATTGTSFDAFVHERIFRPLGMTRSNTSTKALGGMTDVATPHAKRDGEVSAVPWRNIDNIGPAGSINSSAAEMAQWLRFQLAYGRIGGTRLVDSVRIAETHEPQVVVPRTELWTTMFPAVDLLTWGMGWTVSTYRDERVVEHTGIIDGMHALVGLVPAHRLGVVILSNLDFGSNRLPEALRYRVYDSYFGGQARDWSTELLMGRR